MKTKITLAFAFLSLLFCACDSDFDVNDSPIADYNLFFDYLENDYSYKDRHQYTMAHYKEQYKSEISSNTTQRKLAEVLLEITDEVLKDPHLYFKTDLNKLYSIPEINKTGIDEYEPVFDTKIQVYKKDENLYSNDTKNQINVIKVTHFYTYGTVKSNDKIGYIYIDEYNKEIGGTSSLAINEGVYVINDIIKDLNSKNITSLIVDIRSDAGGSHYIPRYIASRFLIKTADYVKDIYPIGNGEYKEKLWSLTPDGEHGFRTGKIALLTNNLTCSGGEFFVLAMLTRDNLVHIGSNTEGCSGNISDKDLANGWQLRITSSKTERVDGTQYFKVGITPSIIVKNTDSTTDKVLEKAIEEVVK